MTSYTEDVGDTTLAYEPRIAGRIELTDPLPTIGGDRADGDPYVGAYVLVTLHGQPVGMLDLDLASKKDPDAIAAEIQRQLGPEIVRHQRADGIKIAPITAEGFTHTEPLTDAPCWNGLAEDKDLPLISIVIATKDRSAELERCLSLLGDLDYPNFEIVIVDNGASDTKTRDLISRLDKADVRYFSLEIASASLARNKGLQEAKGDLVAFTDDDVVIDKLWLKALALGFARDHEVACVTGLVVPASYDFQAQQWFEEYGGFNKGYESRVYGRKREAGFTALYPYTAGAFGSGNNAAFRRDILLSAKGFDVELGPGTITHAGEDLDAFLTVILNGKKIAYEPAAIISHYHRENYDALERQLYNYGIGLTAVFTKWFLHKPLYALEIIRRIPKGVFVIVNPRSTKNNKKSKSFPRQLEIAEIKGMLIGPMLYWRSRRAARK